MPGSVDSELSSVARRPLEGLLQDLTYGSRVLRRSPGFTMAAALTLAIGIAANTVVFSVVEQLLFRPLPLRDSERLVWAQSVSGGGAPGRVSPPDYWDYRQDNRTFEHVAAMFPFPFSVLGDGAVERVNGAMVSPNFFETLGQSPLIGRAFGPEDAGPVGLWNAAIISHGFWLTRYGGRPDVTRETLTVDGRRVAIVGVAPRDFRLPQTADLWLPCTFQGGPMEERQARFAVVIGRLKVGHALGTAQQDVDRIAAALARTYPASNTAWALQLVPLREHLFGAQRGGLLVLAGSVALVLLVACANVAGLMLARAVRRRPEIAVRVALGASGWRVVQQLLAEALVLFALSAGLGLLLAWGAGVVAARALGDALAPVAYAGVDARVLLATLAVSFVVLACVGVWPATPTLRADIQSVLQRARGAALGSGRPLIRRVLVVVQLAVTTVLLVGAGLLIRSLGAAQSVAPGFDAQQLVTFQVALPNAFERAQTVAFFERLLSRIQELPGVAAAAIASEVPLSDQHNENFFTVEGQPLRDESERPHANLRSVSEAYFDAMGIPVVRGRTFSGDESRRGDRVVAINRALAQRYFGDADPVGHQLVIDTRSGLERFTVVAIVGDVRHEKLTSPPLPEMYVPTLAQWTANVLVRRGRDSVDLVAAIRRELARIDPTVPLSDVTTFDRRVAASLATERVRTTVLSSFAGATLLLAAIGLYGLVAYSITIRTREIGVRMALGATKGRVLSDEISSSVALAVVGVGAGAAIAAVSVRFLDRLLFEVQPFDPVTFATSALVLVGAAIVASYVPAYRAASMNALDALRTD